MSLLEVEIKALCPDLSETEQRISAAGGRFIREEREQDTYYNHPARDFSTTDEALRIRNINDADYVLTYKGPKLSLKSKARVEIESNISDPLALEGILAALGFIKSGFVDKQRKVYSIDEIEICLDRVDGLGSYIELEKMGRDKSSIESELFILAGQLGLENFERKSYLELLLEKGR